MAANHAKRPAKNASNEYAAFENLLKRVVSVPHSEIKARLAKEKRKKRASVSREANDA